jgi:hypothetical protein
MHAYIVSFFGNTLCVQTLVTTQANGSHLSYDEVGLPALYGVFFAFFLLVLGYHVYTHYFKHKLQPFLIRFTTGLLATGTLWCLMDMSAWSVLESSGKPSGFLMFVGFLLHVAVRVQAALLCWYIARGINLSTQPDPVRSFWSAVGLTLVVVQAIWMLCVIAWFASANPADPNSLNFNASWPVVLLNLSDIAMVVWFFLRSRANIQAQTHTLKRQYLFRLSLTAVLLFFVNPISSIAGAASPSYQALRVQMGFEVFMFWAIAVVVAFWLLPRNSSENLELAETMYAAQQDLMGMDSAYALAPSDAIYTAVPNDPDVGAFAASGDNYAFTAGHA